MRWSANFSYVIGLIATDGCLSIDGRHIDFTSKDLDQVQTFAKLLNLKNKIGKKSSGSNREKAYSCIQFGNVKFYRFLLNIGLSPHKSKTLGELKIPNRYFIDFLRGCLDGDGYTYSYWDPRWKSSFMLYLGLSSASMKFLVWIKMKIFELYGIEGKIGKSNGAYRLLYAKRASIYLACKIYYNNNIPYLMRKKYKIDQALGIINRRAEVVKSEYTLD